MKYCYLVITTLISCFGALNAQTENFLKVSTPDIEGDSVASGFEDQIKVLAYDFSLSNMINPAAGPQAGAGRAEFNPLKFTAFISAKTLPEITKSVALGRLHEEIILTVTSSNTVRLQEILEIKVEDAAPVEMKLAGSNGDVPIYEFLVAYSKITIETTAIDPQTGQQGSKTSFTYDVAAQTEG